VKRRWLILIIFGFLVCSVLGFFYKVYASEKPTVAVVLKNTKSEYWAIMVSGIEKGLENFGMKGEIFSSDHNNENQLSILEKVLKEKPNALIFSPENPSASIPILKEFQKEHIPVLLVDTGVNWSGQTSFIGTDNVSLGEKAGELLSSMMQPDDKVALIGKISRNTVYTDRIHGAETALHAVGINTVEGNILVDDANAKVIPVIAILLRNNPDIKGVFAPSDEMALEVLKYLHQNGVNIPVVGADGIIDMLKYIDNGTLKGTVAQNPYDMGYICVENALKAVKGQRVEKKINSDVDIITGENAKSKIDFLEGILKK
jgi:ribose transport system substrate-binding protein